MSVLEILLLGVPVSMLLYVCIVDWLDWRKYEKHMRAKYYGYSNK